MKNEIKILKMSYLVFFILLLFEALLFIGGSQPLSLKKAVKEGELYSFAEDRQYWGELTDFCVKDKFIYVLFEHKGVLKIYDIDGAYIKTCAFKKYKGGCALYTDQDHVYLYDQNYNIYIFYL